MFLPFTDSLLLTTHFDPECAMLADRHYSRRTPGARQFLYSGRKIVIRDHRGDVLFGWLWSDEDKRMDHQTGYNCAIFRNESPRLSSEIILECEHIAVERWGPNRGFTYVKPSAIRSPNPGYCFKRAGWSFLRTSANGKLHLLAKEVLTS